LKNKNTYIRAIKNPSTKKMSPSLLQTQEQYPPFFKAIQDAYSCKEDNNQFDYKVVEEGNATTLYLTGKDLEKIPNFKIPNASDFGIGSEYLK
jgi:hypothetical protein